MTSRLFHTLRMPGATVTVAIALALLGAERRALGGQIEADDFGDLAVPWRISRAWVWNSFPRRHS